VTLPTVHSKGKHLLLRLAVSVAVLYADGQAQVAALWRRAGRLGPSEGDFGVPRVEALEV